MGTTEPRSKNEDEEDEEDEEAIRYEDSSTGTDHAVETGDSVGDGDDSESSEAPALLDRGTDHDLDPGGGADPGAARYVPPHLRKTSLEEPKQTSTQLMRSLKGLLNR